MAKTLIVHGESIIVSDEDFDFLAGYTLWIKASSSCKYVLGYFDGKLVQIHVMIAARMGLVWDKSSHLIDHQDNNAFNNQRENLRIATRSQSQANRDKPSNNTSGYKGVSKHHSGRWQARLRNRVIGIYNTKEEAAKAYNTSALNYYKDFSRLNIVE